MEWLYIDENRAFVKVNCAKCSAPIGRIFRSTTRELDAVRLQLVVILSWLCSLHALADVSCRVVDRDHLTLDTDCLEW